VLKKYFRNGRNDRVISYAVSIAVHLLLLILMLAITFDVKTQPLEFVEISFGPGGLGGSSGSPGDQPLGTPQETIEEQQVQENQVEEKVDVTQTKNTSPDAPAVTKEKETKDATTPKPAQQGQGNKTTGPGGFDIDFGGMGSRKVLNYTVPAYPPGVNKQIDIRLRFTIMPDGSVGSVIPLIKADATLENSAIQALRKWRFEPLRNGTATQTAIIVFPYRLK